MSVPIIHLEIATQVQITELRARIRSLKENKALVESKIANASGQIDALLATAAMQYEPYKSYAVNTEDYQQSPFNLELSDDGTTLVILEKR